ncbi:1,2-phenylacetyl-CoA epoxidase subunit PaaE [Corynebacterium flavescens]|uniref:1,2-phenylacetyl-CoA epoxidase subunit PaaE n=1 Tax=Corynebacterium flavescens TaxID=28028 RepID=UPI003FD50E1E
MTSPTTIPARTKATFHTLSVTEVRKLTADSVEVSLAVPEHLREDYDYIPGQYVALRATIEGQELRRSYSICDVPGNGQIRVAIKRDRGGLFSSWANDELKPGFEIDVMNPQGAFISNTHITGLNNPQAVKEGLDSIDHPHLVAIAAGSGITPIMAIAQTVLSQSSGATFELIFANRSGAGVMFAEEIGDLKDKYPTRFAVHHVLSREQRVNPLFSGRIDAEKLQMLLDNVVRTENVDEWFLCGPFELVQLVRDELSQREVDKAAVRYELFTTGKPTGTQSQTGRSVEADPEGENTEISFTLDGLSTSVASPVSAHESLLNAALRVRSDVPFACAGGVCGTCRAKVIEGEVEMDENYALEADELAAGYVLTCQSHPTTPRVVLDFDA